MIEFDGDEVELTNGAAELDVYLDVVPEGSIPWGIYYLGLSLLSVVVLGGVWIGFVPTETVPELGWAALILAVFLVSSVAQVVQNRRYRLGDVDEPP
jgi:drug/metabolite transporter (DMT)-like permease